MPSISTGVFSGGGASSGIWTCSQTPASDQGADLGELIFTHDQISFPVPGHGPIIGLGWPLRDVDHAGDPATAIPAAGTIAGFTQCSAGA
jgi:hypothetical protein